MIPILMTVTMCRSESGFTFWQCLLLLFAFFLGLAIATRGLGNGQVPLAAAIAWSVLSSLVVTGNPTRGLP